MRLRLGIVVPCYNEQEVISETSRRLMELLSRMSSAGIVSEDSAVYFVDDGSQDRTWSLIEELTVGDSRIHGIKLSRNQGHQSALLAGLFHAEGDAIVSIDADLQDDINVIEEMVRRYQEGYEVVYGVRSSRETDSVFKRSTARLYYRMLEMFGVEIVYDHADYRLLSRRAVDCLKGFNEVNLFLRGVIPQLGLRATSVFYERGERFAGESKYPFRKMLALAVNGITSFSVVPLRLIAVLGLIIFLGSVVMVGWILVGKFFLNSTVPGWASSVLPIYFLGGVQLLSIGILGEYVAKIYMETKRRPRYLIEKAL